MCCCADRAQLDARIEATRANIKRLLQSLQRFTPSDLNPDLVRFALRESQRASEGREGELTDDDAAHEPP